MMHHQQLYPPTAASLVLARPPPPAPGCFFPDRPLVAAPTAAPTSTSSTATTAAATRGGGGGGYTGYGGGGGGGGGESNENNGGWAPRRPPPQQQQQQAVYQSAAAAAAGGGGGGGGGGGRGRGVGVGVGVGCLYSYACSMPPRNPSPSPCCSSTLNYTPTPGPTTQQAQGTKQQQQQGQPRLQRRGNGGGGGGGGVGVGGEPAVLFESPILLHKKQNKMVVRMTRDWRVNMGLTDRDVEICVLSACVYTERSNALARCPSCNHDDGSVLEIYSHTAASHCSRNPQQEDYFFLITTICTSSRLHLGAPINIVITFEPSKYCLISEPLHLRSRPQNRQQTNTDTSPPTNSTTGSKFQSNNTANKAVTLSTSQARRHVALLKLIEAHTGSCLNDNIFLSPSVLVSAALLVTKVSLDLAPIADDIFTRMTQFGNSFLSVTGGTVQKVALVKKTVELSTNTRYMVWLRIVCFPAGNVARARSCPHLLCLYLANDEVKNVCNIDFLSGGWVTPLGFFSNC
ncbi:hypothetical protein Pelo_7087 [Pelomyxa schiedti]|nr:hypothetical protein Pelo_7087 [Pelomyxa schiedti]